MLWLSGGRQHPADIKCPTFPRRCRPLRDTRRSLVMPCLVQWRVPLPCGQWTGWIGLTSSMKIQKRAGAHKRLDLAQWTLATYWPTASAKLQVAAHYAVGIAPAIVYGVLRHEVPGIRTGRGALFGMGLSLLQDEGVNTLTRLAARPNQYSWQAHARGLVAHTVYGLVLDAALDIADKLRAEKRQRVIAWRFPVPAWVSPDQHGPHCCR